jgi:sulfofructose kinase
MHVGSEPVSKGASSKPVIVCVGLSALDYIWQADRLPDADLSKVRAHRFVTAGGGMAATAAVTVARLGGDAHFWGRAGDDPAGHVMRDELVAEGVDASGFRLFPEARSSASGVFVDGEGERHIINFRGHALPDTAGWLPLEKIASASAVLSDPRWPDGTETAFAAARRAGVPTVLDAEVADADIFERLLPLTDHAIFSQPALAGFAGTGIDAALERIESHGCRISAVTLGEAGVEWREGGESRRLPAFAVSVIDTNGAGDVFHGAYAFAIGTGMEVGEAMAFASAAAALKCSRPAGRGGIPTFDEIAAFQRTRT